MKNLKRRLAREPDKYDEIITIMRQFMSGRSVTILTTRSRSEQSRDSAAAIAAVASLYLLVVWWTS